MVTKRILRDEDFDTPSGFANDFDAVVTEAWFGPPREEYMQRAGAGGNVPFLHLKLEGTDLSQPVEQVWSTGSARKWKVERDGLQVVSEKKAETVSFVSTSRAAELVNRIIALAGEGDRDKGVKVIRERGFYMTEAEFYLGINAHWEQEEMSTVSGETRNVIMPTALYGFEGVVQVAGESGAVTDSGGDFSEEVIGQLVELASGKTEKQVQQQIMRSELRKNNDLLDAVFNRGLLKDLEKAEKLTKGPSGVYI